MKKLYIIRHAKSDWTDITLDDFHRSLSNRGIKNATFMGKLLNQKNIKPDLIISSPALRAYSTAELIAKEIEYDKVITANQFIYDASVDTLQEIITYISDDKDVVFLVGHNPSISSLAYLLGNLREDVPTCSIIEIDFHTDSWVNASRENSLLISYEYPKKHLKEKKS